MHEDYKRNDIEPDSGEHASCPHSSLGKHTQVFLHLPRGDLSASRASSIIQVDRQEHSKGAVELLDPPPGQTDTISDGQVLFGPVLQIFV